MSYLDALLLAVVQALTEFLPISSSGHLVLAQHWLGRSAEGDLLYDVLLHLATTLAVLVYLRRDVAVLVRGLARRDPGAGSVFGGYERRAIGYIVLATLPTGLLGLVIERSLVSAVTRPDVVGAMLMITGGVLWAGRGRAPQRGIAAMRPADALAVGLIQGLAVLPGISRAGTTITGGILLGLERELAARFSLLISVPAILGAALLELSQAVDGAALPLGPYVAGMLLAGVVGYLAIGTILRLVRRRRFYLFAFYLWPLGAGAILWEHLG